MPGVCVSLGNARASIADARRAKAEAPIERLLVWTYRQQRADRMADAALFGAELDAAGVTRRATSRDGAAAIGRAARLAVDIRYPPAASGQLHHDAEALHNQVRRLASGYLVMIYARRGERPDWVEATGLVPVWKGAPRFDDGGQPAPGSFQISYDRNRKPIACRVEPVADPLFVASQRREWAQWRAALAELRRWAREDPARLRSYAVTVELPPVAPWEAQTPKGSPVEGPTHTRD